jgi:hypothetical protein
MSTLKQIMNDIIIVIMWSAGLSTTRRYITPRLNSING